MKNAFTKNLTTPVPQSQAANDRQVKNNAGGFVYQSSDKIRLERFLILGTEKGSYYQDEGELTKRNLEFLVGLIKRNEVLVWDTIKEIADGNRAYRNSPSIFAVAMLFRHGKIKDMPQERFEKTAKKLVPIVCRTSTHLFELTEYFELLGGWNRSKRSAVAEWYESKGVDPLAYQIVKYRQRNGWTHKDLFYLARPWVDKHNAEFVVGKDNESAAASVDAPAVIRGFKFAQEAQSKSELLNLALTDYPNLPWEAIPTQFHKEPEVWKTLFYNGQLKGVALVRNITRLARIGAFDDMVFTRDVATKLTDEEMIRKTRLHPLNFLNALVVFQEGQIDRAYKKQLKLGGVVPMSTKRKPQDWNTNPVIIDALNEGFHKAFKFTEPAGKRTLIALDISGSMDGPAAGLELTCAQVAGAMAMTIAKTEPYYMVRGFSSKSSYGYGYYRNNHRNNDADGLSDLGIAPSMDLNTVLRKMGEHTMGGTDCSLPMVWANKHNAQIDTFIVITDNETWAGHVHPDAALRDYRKKSGIDARLIVVGVNATEFSIADPNDPGMLDVVGADANLPRLVADFSSGRL